MRFDRLPVAVASTEHLTLLTVDEALVALAGKDPRLPIRHA